MQPQTLPDQQEAADRTEAFRLITDGVALGLPIPQSLHAYHFHALCLGFYDEAPDTVDQWAAHLGMPQPARRTHIHRLDGDEPYQVYVSRDRIARLPGWVIEVSCHVPAPDAEVTAAQVLATASALDGAAR
ncbi:hypothetical protein OHB44_27850 [Micromonospora sp. NBC_00821]|uniref:hypothetical protein n=1 Tax=Micromonospora sp. NBC_00821 TaxID=2975977 RepID=UPI002ED6656C|nr:hypothetical protein OHB44_27850 [Micromonospora sp. NBC_00821]